MLSSGLLSNHIRGGLAAALFRVTACLSVMLCLGFTGAGPVAGGEAERLTLDEARLYMLQLINRDRARNGLSPVALEAVATKAAQFHVDTMVDANFNSHWHPDGSKPPQRYTECGGMDYVMENSHGCGAEAPWRVESAAQQLFTREQIEEEERAYFEEKPPNDGHRRNILDPAHTHVGIGLRLVDLYHDRELNANWLASAQEFINSTGRYNVSGQELRRGQPYVVEGFLEGGVRLYNVQILREELPKPIPLKKLQTQSVAEYHGGYDLPTERVGSIFPPPYAAPPFGRMRDDGIHFVCEITPQSGWKPGLYYLLVWAKPPNGGNPIPIAMRTVPLK